MSFAVIYACMKLLENNSKVTTSCSNIECENNKKEWKKARNEHKMKVNELRDKFKGGYRL